ncbi:MAG: hypothetical protein AB7U20_07020 [Planctomycetaceae bacterium]
MIGLLQQLWRDDDGYLLSAEAVTVGTVGLVGATVGISAVSRSVNDELTEAAYAIRCLDQSYSIAEQRGIGAWTAGSKFVQPSLEISRAELDRSITEQGGTPIDRSSNRDAGAVPFPIDAPVEEPARLDRQQDQFRSPAAREELRRIRQRQRLEQQLTLESRALPSPDNAE